ncbi:HalOD1 output domain-containing protein [Natrinema sp. 1APR25-10V2]|uniref:HalOD1 output domain-containing protein n=1 Tax=Natrinema sp. 1APR25-10V2 TaxID=2951081 RepID=UPI0028751393|nr:HalOD1 output domain-containing protein [Natrinema sp. 1APR25-10V2]MDS0477048.1 hypothetical protein [Natrinema sp. 1APR25-10V2]
MRGEGEAVSLSVVQQVAARENVDPVELTPPLHDVIETDALDALFSTSDGSDGELVFRYLGYTVRVDSAGGVDVVDDDSLQVDSHSTADAVEEEPCE